MVGIVWKFAGSNARGNVIFCSKINLDSYDPSEDSVIFDAPLPGC
jgi:hypothetical protein